MIGLIDYGMGNMHSIAKALEHAGGNVTWIKTPGQLQQVERIVLPGVGAFRDCMKALQNSGMDRAIVDTINNGKPFLGICLGMQVLMDISHEFGNYHGLGLIPGSVNPFPASHPERGYKIPHMGWNDVILSSQRQTHPVLAPLIGQQVYYVHSFYCAPEHEEHLLAACSYGDYSFAAAIGRDNIIAVQFHPEKSQRAGLAMLKAFIEWKPS